MSKGLAQFQLIDGSVFEQETFESEILNFILGETTYWLFDFDPDETGVARQVYVPFHAIAFITWNETAIARKKTKNG